MIVGKYNFIKIIIYIFLLTLLISCPAVIDPDKMDSELSSVLMGLSADSSVHKFVVKANDNLQYVNNHSANIETYENDSSSNEPSSGKIHLVLPPSSRIDSILPTLELGDNSSYSPSGVLDLNNVQSFLVEAEDGQERYYEFTYEIEAGNSNEITGFMLKKKANPGKLYYDIYADYIDSVPATGEVYLTVANDAVPPNTVINDFIPSFEISGTDVVSGVSIQSGVDLVNFDTLPPIIATTFNVNGAPAKNYDVIILVEQNKDNDITSFYFDHTDADNTGDITQTYYGTITGSTINVNIPITEDITTLKPTIAVSPEANIPVTIMPADFSVSQNYTVNAEDGTSQMYTVNVTQTGTLSSAKDITSFEFNTTDNPSLATTYTGTITGTDINVDISASEDITALLPAVTVSADAAYTPGGSQDFSMTPPFIYTVTAEDGSTQNYNVYINVLSNLKNINAFVFDNVINTSLAASYTGVITGTDITVDMPSSEAAFISSLTPSLSLSPGAAISPSGTQDYTGSDTVPFVYTVTAEDGSSQNYNVSVNLITAAAWVPVGGAYGFSDSTANELEMDVRPDDDRVVCVYKDSINSNSVSALIWDGVSWGDHGNRGITGGLVTDISMTIDSGNNVYIINQLSTAGNLRIYEYTTGPSWTAAPTDISADVNMPMPDIEATLSSKYIIYRDVLGGDQVTVSEYNGATITPVNLTGLTTSTSSNEHNYKLTAVGNTLYAAYYNNVGVFTVQEFASGWLDAGSASFTAVDTNTYFDMADQNGVIYSATVESGNIIVRKKNGSTWDQVGNTITDADVSTTYGNFIKLEVSYAGDVYLFYRDTSYKPNLIKINSAGTAVTAEGVLAGDLINNDNVAFGSIAVDQSDKVYIAYRDDANAQKITVLTYE